MRAGVLGGWLRLVVGVVVLAGCFVAWCVPVFAGTGFAVSSFGPAGGFAGPSGLAVNDSAGVSAGDVYVADQGNEAVDEFSAGGVPGATVKITGASLRGVSVDSAAGLSEGDVFVAGFASGVVYRFAAGLGSEAEVVKGLGEPTDAVADGAGDIFVAEFAGNEGAAKVLEFNAAGEPVDTAGHVSAANTIIEGLSAPQALAVNASGSELYVATAAGTLKYTLTAGVYTVASEPFDAAASSGVTLAASGDVYVDQGGEIAQYEPNDTLLATFPTAGVLSGSAAGVGVNRESGDVYVADPGNDTAYILEPGSEPAVPTTEAAQVNGATVVLNGTLAAGTTGYYFAYNAGGSCEGASTTTPVSATAGKARAEVSGLAPATQYSFCLVATNTYGPTSGAALTFTSASVAPEIARESFTTVTARGATLTGEVNPENLKGSYYYEYSTTSPVSSGSASTPVVPFEKGDEPLTATVNLGELEPSTEYHFKLVATNSSNEVSEGPELSFRTLALATSALPDERTYEMVTPVENHNADVHIPTAFSSAVTTNGTPTQFPFQVSTEGTAVTYPADPTIGGLGHGGNGSGNQYLAIRALTGGWTQTNIQPAARNGTVYQGFAGDLSSGFLASGGEGEPRLPPLSAQAPGEGYRVLYACTLSAGACTPSGSTDAQENPFTPLFGKPLNRGAGEFGTQGYGEHGYGVVYGGKTEVEPVFAGVAGSGAGGVLFEANDALIAGEGVVERELEQDVKQEMVAGEDGNYLYDSVGGRLGLVDVLPDGKVAPDATFGARPLG